MIPRNRIKDHRRVRAGDLVPHEFNWRAHPDRQREVMEAILAEVGFARSLLAYEMPDGRLKLIDGHLRRDLNPDMIVDVEVLDVNDAEARKLLLSIDPLAGLAETETAILSELASLTKTGIPQLEALWKSLARGRETMTKQLRIAAPADQFLILVECISEREQVDLLHRFQKEGIPCRALVS